MPSRSSLARHWRLDPNVVFLNHGSFGACPTVVLEKQREFRDRMEREPVRFYVEEREALMDEARGALAKFVNADAEGLVFVPNATAGVNSVVRSLKFAAGDELLTNQHEYNACNNVLMYVAEQWGARVVSVPVPFPVKSEDEIVAAVLAGVTARTRLALISHITSPTGLVMPVQRLVRELQSRSVDVIVDGAHAPGMLPLDVSAIGAAYYTGNCHKWLCTPKGSAFLHIREDRREGVRPWIISHGANSVRTDRTRLRLEFDYTGTTDLTGYLAIPEAIRFIGSLDPAGWPGVMKRNRELALAGRRILCRALGVEPPVPESMIATLAAVPIADRRAGDELRPTKYHDALQDVLISRHRIQVPIHYFPEPPRRLVRISGQLYNTLEEVEYLAGALVAELRG